MTVMHPPIDRRAFPTAAARVAMGLCAKVLLQPATRWLAAGAVIVGRFVYHRRAVDYEDEGMMGIVDVVA
jgi:hypothetical protein